jgi:hypothetical protein
MAPLTVPLAMYNYNLTSQETLRVLPQAEDAYCIAACSITLSKKKVAKKSVDSHVKVIDYSLTKCSLF